MPGPVAFPALLDNRNVNSGPALSVYSTNTLTVPLATYTKIIYNTKEFDTCGGYNTSTGNYRPNVAGYYMIVGAFGDATGTSTDVRTALYKNDQLYKYSSINVGNTNYYMQSSWMIYLNGTSDYISIYGYLNGTANPAGSATITYMQAVMIRPA
jgi:hypothetical protein